MQVALNDHKVTRQQLPGARRGTRVEAGAVVHDSVLWDDVHVAVQGGRNPAYREEDGQRVMKQSEITVRVLLGRGTAQDTVWTCDLSYDYVKINADYRS